MKIFVSYPPLKGPGCPTLGQNRQFQWFSNSSHIYPMITASAATLLKNKGHDVYWDDCIAERKDTYQFYRRLHDEKPDLIAMETKTPVVRQHWEYTEKIKALLPETYVVLMGDHITAKPSETMENSACDFVLTGGDFDFSLLSIADYIENRKPLLPGIWYRENGKIHNTGNFNLSANNLDCIPWIDRDLTCWKYYGEKLYKKAPFTYIMSGRDCAYGKCTFCSWTGLFSKFRVRSHEDVVEEISYLISKYGVREIFDDTGTFPSGNWLEKFCQSMIKKGLNKKVSLSCNFRYDLITRDSAVMMKRAGFRLMKMGLESANQQTLDRLKKGITVSDIYKGCQIAKDVGLELHLTMMLGYPWETRKDAMNTVKLAETLMKKGYASMLQTTIIIPYPGTPFYDEALRNHWFLCDPEEYDKFDMRLPVLSAPDMEPLEIKNLCKEIYKSFLSPGYLLHQLLRIRYFSDILFYMRGLKPVFGHISDFGKQ